MGFELEDHWTSTAPEPVSTARDAIEKFWIAYSDDKLSLLPAISQLITEAHTATVSEQAFIVEISQLLDNEQAQKLLAKIPTPQATAQPQRTPV